MTIPDKKPACCFPFLIALTFLISRLLFHAMGVRFDASGIDWYWQYLDVELLKTDLLRSVFYQHSQPPLFNLLLGLVLKCFPTAYAALFAMLFKALSLSLYYMLFRVLSLLRFKPWIAYLAATLFMLSPGTVLYENWLFYTWPMAVALTFAAYQLLLYGQNRRAGNAALYIVAICIICLTRSMFHLVYLVPAVVPLVLMAPPPRKWIGLAAGLSIVLVTAVFAKNLLLFGFFGSSSWMGMNLWKVVPIGGKSAQLADSPVAQLEPFSSITDYPDRFQRVPPSFAAIPALAAECRQNAKPNLNHFGYIAVSDSYRKKGVELIRADIWGYAGIVLNAWGIYFAPAGSYPLLASSNIDALRPYTRITAFADPRWLVPSGLILMVLCFKGGIARQSPSYPSGGQRLFFIFCFSTVLYAAILGNLLEHGENMRFRVQTDPLLYLAALYSIHGILWNRGSGNRLPENHGEKV
jgi:hypothetical protein